MINAKAGILHFLLKSNGVGGKSCVEPEQLDFDRLRAVSFFLVIVDGLLSTINLHNFTFSLAAQGYEERRKTTSGIEQHRDEKTFGSLNPNGFLLLRNCCFVPKWLEL